MAADYEQLRANLRRFYDFSGKSVICAGAGGGRLLDPTVKPKKFIAIDRDAAAIAGLAAMAMPFTIEFLCAKFEDVSLPCDVVYFEFCLHEMDDPDAAFAHARTMASDIVVFDHLPDSKWSFYAAEENQVRRAAEAVERVGVKRRETFCTEQRFKDHAELAAKLASQGPVAIERAQDFAGMTNIVIPMPYGLALL